MIKDNNRIHSTHLRWSNALSVGSDEIDADHRKLIGLLNEMSRAKTYAQVVRLFDTISRHLDEHFAKEESCQATLNYAGYEWHRGEHRQMARRIKAIGRVHLARLARQHPERGAAMVRDLMADCIVSHVLTADRGLEEIFRRKQAS